MVAGVGFGLEDGVVVREGVVVGAWFGAVVVVVVGVGPDADVGVAVG